MGEGIEIRRRDQTVVLEGKNDGKLVATTSTIDGFFGALIVQKRAASIRIDCATNRFTLDGLENARAIGSLESGNLIIRTERINEGTKPRFCARDRFSLFFELGKARTRTFLRETGNLEKQLKILFTLH